MPFQTPKWSVDRDDWGDLPEDIRDQTGFTGDNMPRDPGGSGTGPTVRDASRMGGADLATSAPYRIYWSDTDTDSTGGIVVGAHRDDGTGIPGNDFTVRKGAETLNVPATNQPASSQTTYYVYFVEGDSSISISQNKSDALDYDRVYLGSIQTGQDETGGGSDPGSGIGNDDGTLQ